MKKGDQNNIANKFCHFLNELTLNILKIEKILSLKLIIKDEDNNVDF